MIEKDDHNWIPIEKALAISQLDDEETTHEETVQDFCGRIKALMSKAHQNLDGRQHMMDIGKIKI